MKAPPHLKTNHRRRGAILIVVLWVLIVLSLLVGTLAFEMHVESNITSYYRKRVKAQFLAQAGIEWAKLMLIKAGTFSDSVEDQHPDLYLNATLLNRGMPVSGFRHQLGEGEFVLDLVPEQGRRNVNTLTEDDWREILDQTRVPEEKWDELIDAFFDWTDPDEAHRLNGAESDDAFYEDRGYEVKNGPLDTVDELLLIKGFTPPIVFGGPAKNEEDPPMSGFASMLTAWGDGRVNVNTASRDVLLTLPEMDELSVDAILQGRAGIDGIYGTEDDGFSSVEEVLAVTGLNQALGSRITTTERRFIRATSVGEVQGVQAGVWAIFRQQGNNLVVVYWREESMQ
jgi:general secretion pathway protein K